jgi:iron complex outermembrane receptor protein
MCSLTGLAQAQQPVLEEVVVTAQKRAQDIQEVPIAVTAFGGDQIATGNIAQLTDIALRTPGVTMSQFNIGEPQIYIRGIGNSNDSAGGDPAVGVFVDEVYIGRSGGAAFDLVDLDRIEVLRGPQGTLYGKNTAGGTISLYTVKPSQDFYVKTSVTTGNYDLWNVQGMINGGLSDTVSGKLVYSYKDREGYAKNVTTNERLQDENNNTVRAQLLIEPSEDLAILLGADYSKDDQAGNCRHLGHLENSPFAALWRTGMSDEYLKDVRNCAGVISPEQERDIYGFLGRVDWEVGVGTLTSISAYRSSDYSWADDLTGLRPPSQIPTVFETVLDFADEDAWQFSQEIRLAGSSERFDWVAGLYYMTEDIDRNERFYTEFTPFVPLPFPSPGDVTFYQENTTDSYAAFGQLDWHFADRWTLALGLRYSYDEKDMDQGAANNLGTPVSGIPLLRPAFFAGASKDWDEWTPKATLSYQFNDDVMAYATYSRGFKSGAFPSAATTAESATTPAEPEIATNYEVGLKSRWLDNRAQLNLVGYYIDYEDLQVYFLQNFLLNLANAQAESQGVEAEFTFLLAENLQLSGSYAWTDTEYEKLIAPGRDWSGNELTRAPENTYSLALNYDIPLPEGAALGLEIATFWKDDYYHDPSNDPGALEDDVAVWNASATVRNAADTLSLVVWGKNLSDEEYRVHTILDATLVTADVYAPPQTYGVTLNYRFE